jgi:ABC-type transport system involved in cytochrome bd biosynthesis fused ATPase/permease subunit
MKTFYSVCLLVCFGGFILVESKRTELGTAQTAEIIRINNAVVENQRTHLISQTNEIIRLNNVVDATNELKAEVAALQARLREQEEINDLRAKTIRVILIILDRMVKHTGNAGDGEISQKSLEMLKLLTRSKFDATEYLWKTDDEKKVK